MATGEPDDDAGYEGDISDKAGDRLGGDAEPKVEVAPMDLPSPLMPEP
ncbi:MAG: hypothetical protein JWL91_1869 [Sphingomonas bacterium]|nr:hypothetical protein [Sphingomonas bacterium]MDB5689993.1 hypothetical protein [Sphingomonas bacterium]